MSTHDARLVPIADRTVQMVDDAPVEDGPSRSVVLPRDASLFERGDPSDSVYVIESGEIEIVRVLADGEEQHLARLGPGQ